MNNGFVIAGMIGTQEIVIILILVLLLFGGKKIPELMRGIGKGVKEFKDATNGKVNTEEPENKEATKIDKK